MKKLNKILLGAATLLFSFTLFSCGDDTNVPTPPKPDEDKNTVEKTELKFKSAVLTSIEGTSNLSIKASVNGDKGCIYAVLSDKDETPKAADIVAPSGFVWHGNSGTSQSLEATIENLTAGKDYYAFFVIKDNDQYSDVTRKTATTIEPDIDKGEGTKENPFKVSTIEDLEHVGMGPYDKYNLDWNADEVYYRLENDIDLTSKYGVGKESWTPLSIGREASFDGNGHTISGVYIDKESTTNLGLFSGINIGGVVKNLTVSNVHITSNGYNDTPRVLDTTKEGDAQYTSTNVTGFSATGIYVGALTGDCKGAIEDVTVLDAVLNVKGSRVGGLTGRIYSDEGTAIQVNRVAVEANITGVSRLGGIVGLIDAKKNTTFETPIITNVTFKGTIKGETKQLTDDSFEAGEYVGGFAGYARVFDASNIVVDATVEGLRHAGGIVGFLQKNKDVPNNNSILKNSLFKGTVQVEIGKNAGPIVGNRSTSNATDDNCIAEGFYLASTKLFNKEVEVEFDKLPATAKWGKEVSELTQEWFTENLPSFDFDTQFELKDGFPVLK